MEHRRGIKYSIIRYSPDEIKGEIINIGVIMHDYKKSETKFNILDENSIKLKSILESKVDINTYKSYKDVMEYYLNKVNEDLSGTVGNKTISSCYSEDFLKEVYSYYKGKKMYLSEPTFAMTSNMEKLFASIFDRYICIDDSYKKITTINAKEHIKRKFEELNLIGRKIKADSKISPIKELDDYKIKVDFTFKNGVWNYIQTMPKNPSKNMDWYSKLQVMSENLSKNDAKIHLIYEDKDIEDNKMINKLINYLSEKNNNIDKIDVTNETLVNKFCKHIEEVGEVLEDKAI